MPKARRPHMSPTTAAIMAIDKRLSMHLEHDEKVQSQLVTAFTGLDFTIKAQGEITMKLSQLCADLSTKLETLVAEDVARKAVSKRDLRWMMGVGTAIGTVVVPLMVVFMEHLWKLVS